MVRVYHELQNLEDNLEDDSKQGEGRYFDPLGMTGLMSECVSIAVLVARWSGDPPAVQLKCTATAECLVEIEYR